jgi:hypothetical protein
VLWHEIWQNDVVYQQKCFCVTENIRMRKKLCVSGNVVVYQQNVPV